MYNLLSADVKMCQLIFEGVSLPMESVFRYNFDDVDPDLNRAFGEFLKCCNFLNRTDTPIVNPISLNSWRYGYTMLPVYVSPQLPLLGSGSQVAVSAPKGRLDLEVTFGTATAAEYTFFLLCGYYNSIALDGAGIVTCDYIPTVAS